MQIAGLHQLLEIVGDVGALVVASGLQLARRHLVVADVEQQQGLHRVDLENAQAFELVLQNVKQQAVQPFHQRQAVEILGHEGRSIEVSIRS